jgi:hypothetical protein
LKPLEVAVQDALLVRRHQSRAELPRELNRLGLGQPPDAAQQRGEILAVDELHRDVVLPVHLADVVDATDIGVGDLERDLDLVEKTVESRPVALDRLG